MMNFFCLLYVVLAISQSRICDQPQRTFYMSYPTLRKRDALHKLFQQMNPLLSTYNSNYTDQQLSGSFKIIEMKPNVYYNDNQQTEIYISQNMANVSMGAVQISSFFNYSIQYRQNKKTGKIRVRTFLDPSYFTKNLTLIAGYIQWSPDAVPPFSLTQSFYIENSQPKLTDSEYDIFNKMLNNQAGQQKIRSEIIVQINSLYPPMLKTFINHGELINTNQFDYKYKNISMTFQTFAKKYSLINGQTKSLEVFLMFGLNSSTENCNILPKTFDEDQFGEFQQVISFSTIRAIVKQALSKGLFDVDIDQNWQTPSFQLNMGNLGMSVPYANYAPAGDKFTVACIYQSTHSEGLRIKWYDDHDIYISAPISCTIKYTQKPIITFEMDNIMVIRLVGLQTSLRVQVIDVGVYGIKYTSVDSNYKIENTFIAKDSIIAILNGLIGQSLFGTGYPLMRRRHPAIRVFDDRIVIYDPSKYQVQT